ncbi:MAG TPA: hypothetical protein VF593_07335 [Chthoniobacteraceae bacterium]|jgi:hypothetical protein
MKILIFLLLGAFSAALASPFAGEDILTQLRNKLDDASKAAEGNVEKEVRLLHRLRIDNEINDPDPDSIEAKTSFRKPANSEAAGKIMAAYRAQKLRYLRARDARESLELAISNARRQPEPEVAK